MHHVIKEILHLGGGKKMYRSLCLTPIYFGNFFYGIEKWWFNLIITLSVGGEQTDLGFTFCFGSALGKSVN